MVDEGDYLKAVGTCICNSLVLRQRCAGWLDLGLGLYAFPVGVICCGILVHVRRRISCDTLYCSIEGCVLIHGRSPGSLYLPVQDSIGYQAVCLQDWTNVMTSFFDASELAA